MDDPALGVATLDDVKAEGRRLAVLAMEAGLPLRLMGGVAVALRCPSTAAPPLARTPGDVDLVGLSRARSEITDFLEANGYLADRMFNALHGAQRLNFSDPNRGRPVDVILDRFSMCHAIDLRDRLLREPLTIPLADLLLTKLQVVALNDKDVRDLLALAGDHDESSLELDHVARVLGDDWGFEHTVRRNLDRLTAAAPSYGLDPSFEQAVVEHVAAIRAALDAAPKTTKWRLRAIVGERVRWYEEPEEARR